MFRSLDGFSADAARAFMSRGTATDHIQVGRGRLRGELGFIPLAGTGLRSVQYSVDLCITGTGSPDYAHILFVVDAPAPIAVSGAGVGRGGMVLIDGGSSVDARIGGGVTWVGMQLPAARFSSLWQGAGSTDILARGHPVLGQADRGSDAALREALAEIDRLARRRPELFEDSAWLFNVERMLLDLYMAALVSGIEPAGDARQPLQARRIIGTVNAFVSAHEEVRPSIAELCSTLKLGQRRLERAFLDVLGLRPNQYLRLRALNLTREALMDPRNANESVTRCAVRHGFWHFGRFAGYYKALFGETPSETKRRTVQRTLPAQRGMRAGPGFRGAALESRA